tara:strand:- start:367 stop:570 length:204 start_codon:yes stop_codon:yes gene_type:complete
MKEETMTIDILVKVYKKWGEDNDIENLGSADEELMWNSSLNDKQVKWLEKFILVWDKIEVNEINKNQ